MMTSIFSLQFYFALHAAIVCSYLFSRTLLCLPIFKNTLSQAQQLRFARASLLIALISFTALASLSFLLPEVSYIPHFQPISDSTIRFAATLPSAPSMPSAVFVQPFPWSTILYAGLILGLIICALQYVYSMWQLRKIYQQSFCRHRIANIHILFSDHTSMPFCFSFLLKHYVVLPTQLLTAPQELRIAIKHELQHLRQGDTYWLHFLKLLTIMLFCNPCIYLLRHFFDDLQEFACDEAMIVRNNITQTIYAQSLVNHAKTTSSYFLTSVLRMKPMSKTSLFKRVNKLYQYQAHKHRFALIVANVIGVMTLTTSAYALNDEYHQYELSQKQIVAIAAKNPNSFPIQITPEVVQQINLMRSSQKYHVMTKEILKRMETYKPIISSELTKRDMPKELMAIPMIESGYRPLTADKNRVQAAGIWQIIPSTAKHFGLRVDQGEDERLDTTLATKAALDYLQILHKQFQDWNLAVIAYEYGENKTAELMRATGSRNPWQIARTTKAPAELKSFLATFNAAAIVLNHPTIINQ